MHLTCAACARQLTFECRLGRADEHDVTAGDREPAVPQGVIVQLTSAEAHPVTQFGQIIHRHLVSEAGALAVHPEDVLPGALISTGTDNGCCGSDGSDGPNRSCPCGAVLGTEWSDCWTRAEVRFCLAAVRLDEP